MPRVAGVYTLPAAGDATPNELLTAAKWDTLMDDFEVAINDSAVGPASATDEALARFDATTGKLLQNSAVTLTDAGILAPATSDAATLGSGTKMWSDAFFASGAVLNFNNSNYTVTHSAGALAFSGAINPSANDGAALGVSGTAWADLFLASGAVVNFNAGNYTITHSAGSLAFNGGVTGITTLAITGAFTGSTNINISGLTEDTSPDIANDFLLTYDTSATSGKKVKPANLGIVVGPASSTDNAVARFDSTTGKLIQNSALIVDDTSGRISKSGNGGIAQQGTNTNDSPAAGDIGELIESTLASGSATSLTNSTAKTITSISLTAGHWLVWGNVGFTGNASTTISAKGASISQVDNTLPTGPNGGGWNFTSGLGSNAALFNSEGCVMQSLKLSGTTTVYLVGFCTFAVSTMGGYGYIGALRVR